MSTRFNAKGIRGSNWGTSFDNVDIPTDFEIPSCGIEDVDKALFRLFNEELPLMYEQDGESKRVPVIFATGERAFILRRKQPLRDRQGALILPMVSILRSGIEQDAKDGQGVGPGSGEIVLKKRISEGNEAYRRLLNIEGLENQEGVGTTDKHAGPSTRNFRGNTSEINLRTNKSNIYEIITIPSPRFFTASYEITFWTQYLQQMNNMQEALMSSYNLNPAKTFRIESDKGYWFVAHVDSGLSNAANFDGFEDDERVIKSSFNVSVTGYIINPGFPGAPNPFRRYISAPKISFETPFAVLDVPPSSPLPSGDPSKYVLEDLESVDDPYPGSSIGSVYDDGTTSISNIGGKSTERSEYLVKTIKDPFSGETKTVRVSVKTKNKRKGETVYHRLWTLG
ncbi:MAG: hypothetical protein CBC29_05570 [Methylococcaceae bacterium TMED69]|nr:MAG: hypothetical protein CBC29_05570 [Methylococcaceae bacterium TMED69]|tara:strand:+ start:1206 stop:2393 length:1188 start_codon:yes stop_codon:yes gene_type:complete